MSKEFDIPGGRRRRENRKGDDTMTTEPMPLGAMIFLFGVLGVFAAMDLVMLVTLLRPGDERGQVVVWKASAWTLLAVVGTLILDVIENFVRGEYMGVNPFILLEVTAIIYCVALVVFKKRHGG